MAEKTGRPPLPEPSRAVGIDLPESMIQRINALAKKTHWTKTYIHQEALLAYLKKQEKVKKK